MTRFPVRTRVRTELIEISDQVKMALAETKVKSGYCVVYCPHTTAGLTIQENADPHVVQDVLLWLNNAVPKDLSGFRHVEGNSDAHIKATLVGSSVTIPIDDFRLALGTWQGIFFCEFDGPRTRSVVIQVVANPET
jgi:secondary thiamine-phosphate synthase enzyme